MRLLTFILLITLSLNLSSQSKDKTPPNDTEQSFQSAMEELERAMSEIDLNEIFSQDFSRIFQDSISPNLKMDDIDSLFGFFNLGEMFGEEFQSEFDQNFTPEMLEQQIGESMKLLEQLDMNEFQNLFEGLDFQQFNNMFDSLDMNSFDELFKEFNFEGFDMQKERSDEKNKKIKRI